MGWIVSAALVPFDAIAQNMVYHSPNDDGFNPGFALNLPIGPSESLYLYLDAGANGSQNGTACSDGDGRELCGYQVVADALGGAFFVDFIPESNVVHSLTSSQLNANGLFGLNPALGPVRIGELKVGSSGPGSEVMIMGGEAVLAALQIEPIPQSIVANTPVPEPGVGAGLLIGVTVLIGAHRVQRRRAPRH